MGIASRAFAFATVHRPENTEDEGRWTGILASFREIARRMPILWPAHPRTRQKLEGVTLPGVTLVGPMPYLQTQALLSRARVVMTDSGGLQKEAAFHRVPCVTLRDTTEWVELTYAGVNVLCGARPSRIVAAAESATWPAAGLPAGLYGNGQSASQIAAEIARHVSNAQPVHPHTAAQAW
jgi:UDP-GlcNAc3NAcA epimerase